VLAGKKCWCKNATSIIIVVIVIEYKLYVTLVAHD